MAKRTAAELLDFATKTVNMHSINRRVWYYALLGAIYNRADLNGYYVAWPVDSLPDLFIPASILSLATEGTKRQLPAEDKRQCSATTKPTASSSEQRKPKRFMGKRQAKRQDGKQCYYFGGTGGATPDAENTLWYFREDVMLNGHHWIWHQYFPQNPVREIDRRGEMFLFSHHNVIARYNAERLSNGLDRVEAIDMRLNANIGAGYSSNLVEAQSKVFWTSRPENVNLKDINHQNDPDFLFGVTMVESAKILRTLYEHICTGYLLTNKTVQGQPTGVRRHNIKTLKGISDLGDTVESAEPLSLFPELYHPWGIHILGHVAVGLSTDPDYTGKCPTSVMADLTVTMRDPAFYKVHNLVNVLFDLNQRTLPPYQLHGGEWPLVSRFALHMVCPNGNKNLVKTYFSIKRIPIEEGVDGKIHDGDVDADVCQKHLNYEPFTFHLTIESDNCKRGNVRIFMAPRHDLNGKRFSMEDTRRLMFQLDVFPVELKPGRNHITRNAQDSASTKPWSRTLQDMLRDPDTSGKTEYCGCGWPRHLYLPKGNAKGMGFDVFAMITDFEQDKVADKPENLRIKEPCNMPHLFCGIPFRKYPDARPMGYPFDRKPYSVGKSGSGSVTFQNLFLEEYVSHVPNSKATVVKIQHVDTIVE